MIEKNWVRWCWQLVLMGTILLTKGEGAFAQSKIEPDETLGNGKSVVIPNFLSLPVEVIDGGTIRGANLFHSFLEFNVSPGRAAYFYSPSGSIQNILARVTGGNPSRIFGTLGTFGESNPNLFLINPQGIIFGQNASLDVGGSFVATTANAIRLGDTGLFSASSPATSNLLSVSPSALFFNAVSNQAEIVNNSRATTTVLGISFREFWDSGLITPFNLNGLEVLNGQSLLLVGGNVKLEGGIATASGGRVELGGLVRAGTVGLSIDDNNLRLSFPDGVAQADVLLTNGATVDVTAGSGGNIAIYAQNLDLLGKSGLFAGIVPGFSSAGSQGGDITLNATGAATIENSSIFNAVYAGAVGNAGNLTIEAGRLSIRDGGQVTAATFGLGNAGNVLIRVPEVDIFETPMNTSSLTGTGVFNEVGNNARGNAGNLTIEARRLSIRDGAQVTTDTFGRGNAGNILLRASDSIEVAGSSTKRPSFLVADVDPGATGHGGNLTIETKRLSIRDGAQVSTSTFSSTDAGNLTVNALESVEVTGRLANNKSVASGLFAQAEPNSTGNGGNLSIQTNRLTIQNGGKVSTATFGQGKGGSLAISTQRLQIRDQGQVSTSTFGTGNAGNLTVRASEIDLSGASADASSSSSINSQVNYGATGNGGNLIIETGRLIIEDGAKVSASALGEGRRGNLNIIASDSVEVIGRSQNDRTTPSAIFARTEGQTERAEDGGDLTITTGRLVVRNGGQVSASTFGRGNAGNLTIHASESVELTGSSPFNNFPGGVFTQSNPRARGNGGNLTIDTKQLIVRGGSEVSSATLGKGQGGNLTVTARDSVEVAGTSEKGFPSRLLTQTDGDGNAGNLTINTRRLIVKDGAEVSAATTVGKGKGGNLTLTIPESVEVIGRSATGDPSNLSTSTLALGDAGDLRIETGSLNIKDSGLLSSQSRGQGRAGNINISTRNTLKADRGEISTNSIQAGGGNITINARDVQLRDHSDIKTNSSASDGGNIFLSANTIVALEDSDILAFAPLGKGGNIQFATAAFLSDPLYRKTPPTTDAAILNALDGNGQVDVNASGAISGVITGIPDITFLQNSLTELQQKPIDANALIANSCIARSHKLEGTFTITGSGGLPNRPGDASVSSYPTGTVRSVQSDAYGGLRLRTSRPWHPGDPIVEPLGVYRLPNGQLVLSRECGE